MLSWLAWLSGAAVAIGGLFWLASWLFSAAALPQTRCLPEECDWFASISWPKAAGGRLAAAAPGAELRALVQRCTIFLGNAQLQATDVDSIVAGRAADGSGTIVVYRFAHPINCEKIMACPAFRDIGKSEETKETIGGAAVFLLPAWAIAFLDSRTIVSGEKQLVRQVLKRAGRPCAARWKSSFAASIFPPPARRPRWAPEGPDRRPPPPARRFGRRHPGNDRGNLRRERLGTLADAAI